MIFILLTFLAAFSIEVLGTYVSVIGLSTLFGANPVIIALAIALDAGKLVVVSLLYTYWAKLGKIMKAYALIAATITMIITSAGAAGYLSGEFQKAILGTQESSLRVDVLKNQIAKYEERKKQIDTQIAAIPDRYTANQKIRLMNQFKAEQKDLQDKISAIDKQLPELQIHQISMEAKAGPILYIAKAFDIPVEAAVKWVILMIIFVFDPLAVFLIIAGNFLLEQRRKQTTATDETEVNPEPMEPEPTSEHVGELTLKPRNSPAGIHREAQPVIVGKKTVEAWDMPSLSKEQPMAALHARMQEDTPAPAVETSMPEPIEVSEASPSVAEEPTEPLDFVPTAMIDVGEDKPPVKVVLLADVLEPTPEPLPPSAPEPVLELAAAPEVRETITLDDLTRPHSSLNDVKADHSVLFDDSPRAESAASYYRNLR